MEQKVLWKNLTGTLCVLGLAVSTMSFNSTQIIDPISDIPMANFSDMDEKAYNSTFNYLYEEPVNVYIKKESNHLDLEAKTLFGKMREATIEESESVRNYIRSISKNTGVNFFDLC